MTPTSHRRTGAARPLASRELPPGRRRLFIAITICLPFLALLILEGALRLADYGPNLDLFTTESIAGRTYHIMNPDVKARYFAHVEFSPNTSPDYFAVPKTPGTFRIFCLGGSTTVGYPYGYAGSFSTFLRGRLKATFPGRPVEVINLGMTATNSVTVNDIARELVAYEPDLIIVYDGHNEFYGALGIASREAAAGSPWIIRLYLRAVHLRSFQLLRETFAGVRRVVGGSPAPDKGTMMERLARGQYVPQGSDVYRNGIASFSDNLAELRSICGEAGSVSLLLGTQVSNLRDQPPFATLGPDGSEIGSAYDGSTRTDLPGDEAALLAAVESDPTGAEAHYRLARLFDLSGEHARAEEEYRKARDCDALRFRASSDANDAIRAMHSPGSRVFVADLEAAFRRASPDSLIGRDLILEHLHPNARGYFLLAKEYARSMRDAGLLAPKDEWARCDTVSDSTLWHASPLTEVDIKAAVRRTELLTSGWPFVRSPRPVPPARTGPGIGEIVERLVQGGSTWEQAHVAAAEFHARSGEFAKAAAEYRAIIDQLPLNVSAYLALAQSFIGMDSVDRAAAVLARSLDVERTVYALRILGSMSLNRGDLPAAIRHLKDAVSTDPAAEDYPEAAYLLALAYARNKEEGLAVVQLQSLLQRFPSFDKASKLLRALQRLR